MVVVTASTVLRETVRVGRLAELDKEEMEETTLLAMELSVLPISPPSVSVAVVIAVVVAVRVPVLVSVEVDGMTTTGTVSVSTPDSTVVVSVSSGGATTTVEVETPSVTVSVSVTAGHGGRTSVVVRPESTGISTSCGRAMPWTARAPRRASGMRIEVGRCIVLCGG